jgi:hypothetical protein
MNVLCLVYLDLREIVSGMDLKGIFTSRNILVNNQLDAIFQCIYLFPFSTCFEQLVIVIRTIKFC